LPNFQVSTKQISPNETRGTALARAARKSSKINCDLYRDCRSNPIAAILPQRLPTSRYAHHQYLKA
jgi:hypothetical protein